MIFEVIGDDIEKKQKEEDEKIKKQNNKMKQAEERRKKKLEKKGEPYVEKILDLIPKIEWDTCLERAMKYISDKLKKPDLFSKIEDKNDLFQFINILNTKDVYEQEDFEEILVLSEAELVSLLKIMTFKEIVNKKKSLGTFMNGKNELKIWDYPIKQNLGTTHKQIKTIIVFNLDKQHIDIIENVDKNPIKLKPGIQLIIDFFGTLCVKTSDKVVKLCSIHEETKKQLVQKSYMIFFDFETNVDWSTANVL